MLPVKQGVTQTGEREEMSKLVSTLRRHLQWKARAGIRVLPKGRPGDVGLAEVGSKEALSSNWMGGLEGNLFSDYATAYEAKSLEELRAAIGDCRRCKLWPGRTHLVFGVGNPQAQVMFVGEGPGREDRKSVV